MILLPRARLLPLLLVLWLPRADWMLLLFTRASPVSYPSGEEHRKSTSSVPAPGEYLEKSRIRAIM
jgi:hypothetical protein